VTGTITVTAPTGTGMTYSIDGSTYSNTDGMFMSVDAGSYSVTAKSSGGCISLGTSVILTVCTGIANLGDVNTVTIYPNPFSASIDIILKAALKINNAELRIYDVLGNEVLSTKIVQQLTTLKTSNLNSGIYFYKLINNNLTVQSGKLISKQ
jgi:hypothetical protein